jgi:hypothetical protein
LTGRLRGRLTIVLLTVAISAAAIAATPVRVAVSPPSGVKPWISVLPLYGDDDESRYVAAATRDIPLPDGGPVVVCAGAEATATQCRRVLAPDVAPLSFNLTAGRVAQFDCFIGRDPCAGASLRIRPSPFESRRAFSIPLAREPGGDLTRAIVATMDGIFYFDHLAPGRYVADIELRRGSTFASPPFDVPELRDGEAAGTVVRLPAVRIDPGVALTVILVDDRGLPVTNGIAAASQARGDDGDIARRFAVDGRANDKGVVTLSGIDPRLPVRISCNATGHARRSIALDVPPRETPCVLNRLATIAGTILGDHSAPLATATITLDPRIRMHADGRGTFTAANVAPGEYQLRVAAPGYATATKQIVVAPGERTDAGELQLRPGAAFRGKVVDAVDAKPIAGANVVVIDPAGGGDAASNADGEFTIDSDPGGVRVEVTAPRYSARRMQLEHDSDAVAIVALERPGDLEITAFNDATGAPCAACQISIDGDVLQQSLLADGSGIARFIAIPPGTYYYGRERATASANGVFVSGGTGGAVVVKSGTTAHAKLGAPSSDVRVSFNPAPDPSWQLMVSAHGAVSRASADRTGTFHVRHRINDDAALSLVRDGVTVRVGAISAAFHDESLDVPLASSAVRIDSGALGSQGVLEVVAIGGGVVAFAIPRGGETVFPFLQPGKYVIRFGGQDSSAVFALAAGATLDLPLSLPRR